MKGCRQKVAILLAAFLVFGFSLAQDINSDSKSDGAAIETEANFQEVNVADETLNDNGPSDSDEDFTENTDDSEDSEEEPKEEDNYEEDFEDDKEAVPEEQVKDEPVDEKQDQQTEEQPDEDEFEDEEVQDEQNEATDETNERKRRDIEVDEDSTNTDLKEENDLTAVDNANDPKYSKKPYVPLPYYPVPAPAVSVGRWVAYGDWSACTKTCNGGKQYRQRLCHFPPTYSANVRKIQCRGKPRVVRRCNKNVPCQIYGKWGSWGRWSKCSKKCHQGKQIRKRVCKYKSSAGPYANVPCNGPPSVYRLCNQNKPCKLYGYWGAWGAWSQCSKKCHQGFRVRSRACEFKQAVGPVVKIRCKGRPRHRQRCNVNKPCVVYGYWSNWGAWGKCSKKCYKGKQLRNRVCLFGRGRKGPIKKIPCPQPNVPQYRECNVLKPCKIYGYWSKWGAWSDCSKNCHKGKQYRKRVCAFPYANGLVKKVPCKGGRHVDFKVCNDGKPCDHYGYWGTWGAWSKCSKKCHQGRQYRKRLCKYKDYSGPINKIACVGHGVLYRYCNKDIPCDVYGYWGSWGAWSQCSKTCFKGRQYRSRTCLYKGIGNGLVKKHPCTGGGYNYKFCNLKKPCYNYGYWGAWGAWSQCSKNCHQGKHYRTRTCEYPAQRGGLFTKVPCKGDFKHEEPCNVDVPCKNYGYWGAWGSWSDCSKKCHQGKHYRERKCLFKKIASPYTNIPCTGGSNRNIELCNVNKPCPIYGYWGAWGAWSQCSKKCHKGKHYRVRQCLHKLPGNGPYIKVDCKGGSNRHEDFCNIDKPCPNYGYWGAWGSWSDCSKKCHQGKHYRTRSCLHKNVDGPHTNLPCKGGSTRHEEPCNVNKPCPNYGYWGAWGAWSDCSKQCHQGKHYRERKCLYKKVLGPYKNIKCRKGGDRHEDLCNVNKPCPVYGYWGTWGAWSQCSKKCHQGKHYRVRQCLHKLPGNGPYIKVDCKGGSNRHEDSCNVGKPCPIYGYWGTWGAWSGCDKNCHSGRQERKRLCLYHPHNGPVKKYPCVGGSYSSYKTCNVGKPCPVYGYWSIWGSWGSCSKTCHEGIQQRKRKCIFRKIGGPVLRVPCKGGINTDDQPCNVGKPCHVYGYWGSWGAWSQCSKKCHQGKHYRTRTCEYPAQNGPVIKVKCKKGGHKHEDFCNVDIPCKNYGYWGAWGAWSQCSKKCHEGKHYRVRQCLYKKLAKPYTNIPCKGGSNRHEEACNVNKPCHIYGYWGAWGAWSKCSKKCHQGKHYRVRQCLHKLPGNGPYIKVDCKGGSNRHEDSCNIGKPCPNYGYWGAWGAWSDCSKKCHQGKHYRTRSCLHDKVNGPHTDIPCKGGRARHTEACNVNKPCPNYGYWGAWGAWSQCSKKCHQGKHYRERKCLYKKIRGPYTKIACKGGSNRHEEPCNVDKPCHIYGYWGAWGAWSKCSKKCHQGKHYRVRQCLHKLPGNGPYIKVDCKGGSNRHEDSCNIGKPCPNYGYWGAWGAWSDCSKKCHQGKHYRTRSCLHKKVNGPHTDIPCKGGKTKHIEPCNVNKPCPNYGYWGAWGSWSDCSKKCHQGKHYRMRSCLHKKVIGPHTDIPCKGGKIIRHEEFCNINKPCPNYGYWSDWGAWSRCSKNCHKGYRERKRNCQYPTITGPSYNVKCTGGDLHKDVCNMYKTCYLNGDWGTWGSWSACSTTCGRGTRKRQRSCSYPQPYPRPYYAGRPCTGTASIVGVCNTQNPCHGGGNLGCYDVLGSYICMTKKATGDCTKYMYKHRYCRVTCGTCVPGPYQIYKSQG